MTTEIVKSEAVIQQAEMFQWHTIEDGRVVFKENTPIENWIATTEGYMEVEQVIQFRIADCLIFGERKYGERYAQVFNAGAYAEKTLRNWVDVALRIPESQRKFNLSFSIYAVVAFLNEKDRNEILEKAFTERLTVAEVQELAREVSPAEEKKKAKKKTETKSVKVTEDEALEGLDVAISFLEGEESKLAFRKWPANRRTKWAKAFTAIRRISRRMGVLK